MHHMQSYYIQMTGAYEKPVVTVAGKKSLFKSDLHQRLIQDLPQEGVDWRRRLDSNTKSVYIDVEFVDFDVDNVERSSERLSRLSVDDREHDSPAVGASSRSEVQKLTNLEHETESTPDLIISEDNQLVRNVSTPDNSIPESTIARQRCDISNAFFSRKLLGQPTLHTYWVDKTDFEAENQKNQFDEWIGLVQASSCTEWAIIIIEDGDFKAQLGTALFKSKLQSSASQSNVSSTSISSITSSSTTSFLDRMKKGLSTIFQGDSNSERWLTLVNQDKQDGKVQESYASFVKKLRNLISASFSKQIELFEEQLRVQREMRVDKNWDFFTYFTLQEELAFAFEFLTLFDEALMQYDFLDALFTDYMSSPNLNKTSDPLSSMWLKFDRWPGLCLDMSCDHSNELRKRIADKKASLLDFRNYLYAKRCDLMFMQNQPWRVAASTSVFLQNCINEHKSLGITMVPGALLSWSFISALEVLQKCECYSCTSTMENYSFHTVDIWNNARQKLLELGELCHRLPAMKFESEHQSLVEQLLAGIGPDPHKGVSYQSNEISPYARLRDALLGEAQFSKHLIEISELALGTYKHIGRKRHALLVGRQLAGFYMKQGKYSRALPFLIEMERLLLVEKWQILLEDTRKSILECNKNKKEETLDLQDTD